MTRTTQMNAIPPRLALGHVVYAMCVIPLRQSRGSANGSATQLTIRNGKRAPCGPLHVET